MPRTLDAFFGNFNLLTRFLNAFEFGRVPAHPSYPLPLVLSRNVTIRGQPDRWAALSFGYVQR